MAWRLSYEHSTRTSTILLVLLILFDATFVWEQVHAAPAKRNDVVAGTEFLSVFINGAMAPTPRRRGFRRNQQTVQDNAVAESRQSEASIYRISRAPSSPRPTTSRPSHREIGAKLYPVSHKSLDDNRDHTHASDELGTEDVVRLKPLISVTHQPTILRVINGTKSKNISRKVIGVSVTSTVEATPYKVRVEHYDNDQLTMITRPPISGSSLSSVSSNLAATGTAKSVSMITTAETSTISTPTKTSTVKTTSTLIPAKLVTEELSNIVSESNRSEFSVDEGLPRTSWRARSSVTPESIIAHSVPFSTSSSFPKSQDHKDSLEMATSSEPVEQSYELSEENEEIHEVQNVGHLQGRKAGRHYDSPLFNQPPKVYPQPSKIYGKPSRMYGEPSKIYSEPAKIYSEPEKVYSEPSKIYSEPSKIYSEPSKIYSEPSKVYSEPSKVYGEPEKVYGEPSKIYSKPARVYSEPAKVYGEPAKVYSEPSKIYGLDGQPINHEPEEENYEVDEAVSVGSNGNVHGPQGVTEAPNSSSAVDAGSEDGHNKVGYVVEGRNYRKYRVEERTPDGFIVGEYGVVSHDDGSLRGVRYTADGTINPRLIYDALMKFLAL
ncbi:uncharacterized protein LOC130668238 isoform X1 [Microplitis mediator]|uniref:uncharacterized protein LOC130668238 isoform X1 n=2 Tax=Microplitis mediator TaxID=375433 RepID=UPI0025579615|nr:uncharacterized protein LOC130668238 isoform X1 [Microplitis mediator]